MHVTTGKETTWPQTTKNTPDISHLFCENNGVLTAPCFVQDKLRKLCVSVLKQSVPKEQNRASWGGVFLAASRKHVTRRVTEQQTATSCRTNQRKRKFATSNNCRRTHLISGSVGEVFREVSLKGDKTKDSTSAQSEQKQTRSELPCAV